MNLHRDQLISRLKQQPRHGQAADPLSQVTAGLKQVFDLYKVGGDEIIRLNVFGKLADQISGVVRNLSILQDLNQELSEGFNILRSLANPVFNSFSKMTPHSSLKNCATGTLKPFFFL
jgi:hypothetical protein